ncbi:MAG: radical SAM protein [Elusimicrobiota bacterium]
MEYQARHWVRLTAACNNNCVFCLDAAARMGEMLPFADIMEELRRGRELGITRVVLSGGEPTIHPRFLDIVAQARELGYTHIQAISNGRRFAEPGFIERCVQSGLRETTISMHGHTPELHDGLVRVPGAFKQSLAGLGGALKRSELIVSVDIVLNKQNMEVIDDVLWFFLRLGVREFDLLHVVPFASAWDNWEMLRYDPAAVRERFQRALKLARNMGAVLWTNRLPAKFLEGFEDLIQDPRKIQDEVRGRAAMFHEFLAGGKLMGCRDERCGFCFLEGWCEDLIRLRDRGRLAGRPLPKCLSAGGGKAKPPVFRWAGAATDLNEWTRFYIENRYHIKGSACGECAHERTCAGAQIDFIRAQGFKALKPGKKKKRKKTCRN